MHKLNILGICICIYVHITYKFLYIHYLAGVGVQAEDEVLDGEAAVVDGSEEERKHSLETGVARQSLRQLLLISS
jgi:hypothetical protein